MLRNGGLGGVEFPGLLFTVISITRGWVGGKCSGKSITQLLNGPIE